MNVRLELAQAGKIRSTEKIHATEPSPTKKRFSTRRVVRRLFSPIFPETAIRNQSPASDGNPKQTGDASVLEIRRFLDKAILSAAKERLSASESTPLTPAKWVWQLAASYHLTHATPPLMQTAADRFAAAQRWNLAQWATAKVQEEKGHDQLAWLDIQAMGYDANAVVEKFIPSGAIALVNFFTRSAQATDPIKCVGYSYTLERLALLIDSNHIQRVEAALPPDVQATRCLRMHSSLGGDVHHVHESLEVIAGLTPEEQRSIRHACYETACLYFDSLQSEPISEADLQKELSCLRIGICS